MNSAIIMHYTWEKVKRKRLHLEQRQGNNSFGFDRCMKKRCQRKQKQCWVNCNFTGLFVLDNSCNGGIVVQSCSVDFPPRFQHSTNKWLHVWQEGRQLAELPSTQGACQVEHLALEQIMHSHNISPPSIFGRHSPFTALILNLSRRLQRIFPLTAWQVIGAAACNVYARFNQIYEFAVTGDASVINS